MNLGCFLHKRLEDYGNLNPVDFFSQSLYRVLVFSVREESVQPLPFYTFPSPPTQLEGDFLHTDQMHV